MMNKSTVDPNGNYADYLAGTVELNKASFTEAELKTLTEDIDAIRKIEEQIAIANKTSYNRVGFPTFLYDKKPTILY